MKNLTTGTVEHTIEILPRDYTTSGLTMTLRNDSTNEIVESSGVTAEVIGNYLVLTVTLTLVESNFYDMKVEQSGNVIYKDKIFATSQTINQENNEYFTINKDTYVEESGDNDFIII